ncbi:Maf-like protein [soil metagenome]
MNFNQSLILASNSPRRKQLLQEAGFTFTVKTKETDEDFPDDLPVIKVARYLAEKKAEAFREELSEAIIITADTVVICEGISLAKPAHKKEALAMLQTLSGKKHQVVTGMCLLNVKKKISFEVITEVYFKDLSGEEIDHYIDNYKPYDKAGAYGIQEWLGLIGIERINGSYYNVVGLPVQRLYEELKNF